MKADSDDIVKNAKNGVFGITLMVIASVVAAPFTSVWVPVAVVSFFIIVILFLAVVNITTGKRRYLIRAVAQFERAIDFAANVFRF